MYERFLILLYLTAIVTIADIPNLDRPGLINSLSGLRSIIVDKANKQISVTVMLTLVSE